jgi:hypothetical protein
VRGPDDFGALNREQILTESKFWLQLSYEAKGLQERQQNDAVKMRREKGENSMNPVTHDPRIDKMHGQDRIGAIAFVVLLWVVILFVLISIWSNVTDSKIATILIISGGMVLVFNTASIFAMLRHYTGDKHFIYGLDIKHLDEMRSRKQM